MLSLSLSLSLSSLSLSLSQHSCISGKSAEAVLYLKTAMKHQQLERAIRPLSSVAAPT